MRSNQSMPTPAHGQYVVGGRPLPRDTVVNGKPRRVMVKPGEPYPEAFSLKPHRVRAMVNQNRLVFVPRPGVDPKIVVLLLQKMNTRTLLGLRKHLPGLKLAEGATKQQLTEAILEHLGVAKDARRSPAELKARRTKLESPDTGRTEAEQLDAEQLAGWLAEYEAKPPVHATKAERVNLLLLATGAERIDVVDGVPRMVPNHPPAEPEPEPEPAPTAADVTAPTGPRELLEAMSDEDLAMVAEQHDIATEGLSRDELVGGILVAAGYGELLEQRPEPEPSEAPSEPDPAAPVEAAPTEPEPAPEAPEAPDAPDPGEG